MPVKMDQFICAQNYVFIIPRQTADTDLITLYRGTKYKATTVPSRSVLLSVSLLRSLAAEEEFSHSPNKNDMGHKDCVKNKDLVHSAKGSICLLLLISLLFLKCALWTCWLNKFLRKQTTCENSIRVLL